MAESNNRINSTTYYFWVSSIRPFAAAVPVLSLSLSRCQAVNTTQHNRQQTVIHTPTYTNKTYTNTEWSLAELRRMNRFDVGIIARNLTPCDLSIPRAVCGGAVDRLPLAVCTSYSIENNTFSIVIDTAIKARRLEYHRQTSRG